MPTSRLLLCALTSVGLVVTLYGAFIAARAAVLSPKQADRITSAGERAVNRTELAQSLRAQAHEIQIGFICIGLGAAAQLLGSLGRIVLHLMGP